MTLVRGRFPGDASASARVRVCPAVTCSLARSLSACCFPGTGRVGWKSVARSPAQSPRPVGAGQQPGGAAHAGGECHGSRGAGRQGLPGCGHTAREAVGGRCGLNEEDPVCGQDTGHSERVTATASQGGMWVSLLKAAQRCQRAARAGNPGPASESPAAAERPALSPRLGADPQCRQALGMAACRWAFRPLASHPLCVWLPPALCQTQDRCHPLSHRLCWPCPLAAWCPSITLPRSQRWTSC